MTVISYCLRASRSSPTAHYPQSWILSGSSCRLVKKVYSQRWPAHASPTLNRGAVWGGDEKQSRFKAGKIETRLARM
jgi:hypothetical protein